MTAANDKVAKYLQPRRVCCDIVSSLAAAVSRGRHPPPCHVTGIDLSPYRSFTHCSYHQPPLSEVFVNSADSMISSCCQLSFHRFVEETEDCTTAHDCRLEHTVASSAKVWAAWGNARYFLHFSKKMKLP